MDIILHLGAHRTASTSFQTYLRQNAAALAAQGVVSWGPRETRNGLFHGIWPAPGEGLDERDSRRAAGRIALALSAVRRGGARSLIVSDENFLGNPRALIRDAQLYPAAGERLARLHGAFGGQISRLVLSIRSPDLFWPSLIAMTVGRGHPIPGPARLARMADPARSWRDVITDLACAMPDRPILVFPHETYGAVPERRLARMLPRPLARLPLAHARLKLNASLALPALRDALAQAGRPDTEMPAGDGAYRPFDPGQTTLLRDAYRDDLFWLQAGADGLAQLICDPMTGTEGQDPDRPNMQRGQTDDRKGHVAQAG